MAGPDDDGDPADVAALVDDPAELAACTPEPLRPGGFNPGCAIPYGCTVEHVRRTMQEFQDFLGFINGQLNSKNILRFEAMLSPANFSSMVGEFAVSTLPKHCPALVKNGHHNGHPDLLPAGMFAGDALHHGTEGIEVKGSRYTSGWQGHNKDRVLAHGVRVRLEPPGRRGQGNAAAAVRLSPSAARPAHQGRLELFRPQRGEPPDDHRQRHPGGVCQDE